MNAPLYSEQQTAFYNSLSPSSTMCCCLISGKLHLLYEAAPLSFIVEEAGGVSSTGNRRIMDVDVRKHTKTPLFKRMDLQAGSEKPLTYVSPPPHHLIYY